MKKPIDNFKTGCYNEYKFKGIEPNDNEQSHCNGKHRKDEVSMKDFIMKLVKDFNEYSELVALNYSKMKEGKCDEGTLQWNRGNLNRIEDYLKQLAESTDGVNLKWECKEHTFGYDDWKRQLEYRTVRVVFDN